MLSKREMHLFLQTKKSGVGRKTSLLRQGSPQRFGRTLGNIPEQIQSIVGFIEVLLSKNSTLKTADDTAATKTLTKGEKID